MKIYNFVKKNYGGSLLKAANASFVGNSLHPASKGTVRNLSSQGREVEEMKDGTWIVISSKSIKFKTNG